MRSIILGRLLVGLLLVLAVTGCEMQATPVKPTPTTIAASPGRGLPAGERIVTEGRVLPVQSAALSFPVGGIVAQVPVAVGERVAAGKVLAQLETRSLELQLAQAEANLAAAQARLNQLARMPTEQELAAAQQNLAAAQAAYDNLLYPSENEITALKADVDRAWALLSQAQAAYDRVGGDANPHAEMLPQRAQLQMATIDYQRAQALYNARLNPGKAQIQQALAAIKNAQNQLAKLHPSADERAVLQASVNAAQAARDLVAEQIKNARLVAPFAGTVMTLHVNPGEYAAPGVIVLRLADTSAWQIETTDLTELNIIKVTEGTPATMTFDAIPGLTLPGKIAKIGLYGETRQGDIVYTVTVIPDQQDARLRWNMTAKVNIEVK